MRHLIIIIIISLFVHTWTRKETQMTHDFTTLSFNKLYKFFNIIF